MTDATLFINKKIYSPTTPNNEKYKYIKVLKIVKAWDVAKEKDINISMFKFFKSYEEYTSYYALTDPDYDYVHHGYLEPFTPVSNSLLTEEEYNLIKSVL